MVKKQEELSVISAAKDLCSYIVIVTQKSPKHFRYTFVTRIQNLALSVIEELYRANDVFVMRGDTAAQRERLSHQRKVLTDLRLLAYFTFVGGPMYSP